MSRLPVIRARDFVRVLTALGFVLVRQKGSHAFYRHPRDGRTTVVPLHGGEDLDRSLLREILREIRVSTEEFVQLLH